MNAIFQTVLYQPLYNLLIGLVAVMPGHDMGLAIVVITIIIRIVLHPFSVSMFRSQRAMQRLQPKIRELQAEHKENKQEMSAALMKLYRDEKVSPWSSCLPLILQLPILLALYYVLDAGLKEVNVGLLYSFVARPESISPIAFGFLHLNERNIILAVAAGVAQFFQTKMLQVPPPAVDSAGAQDEKTMSMVNKQMLYFMPILTIIIGLRFPAGLTLYWFLTTLLTIFQQWYIFRQLDKKQLAK